MEKFALSEIYTAASASNKRNIPYSTLKDDIVRYRKFDSQLERGLIKKEGRVWLVTEQALNEVYGSQDTENKEG
ncbi:helix-turn-helix domain-containing protein [Sutcliffiella sp. NPDC057660]|uniref:helix-turn-helix domain-containing protein n=1 Tax=Sutcliffiella sp. NPDC057660 TaxID=3346199 RepID=UPI0036A1EEC0